MAEAMVAEGHGGGGGGSGILVSGATFGWEFIDIDLELACCILRWSLGISWRDGF